MPCGAKVTVSIAAEDERYSDGKAQQAVTADQSVSGKHVKDVMHAATQSPAEEPQGCRGGLGYFSRSPKKQPIEEKVGTDRG